MFFSIDTHHGHLSNIDCLRAHTARLVRFISIVNGRSKKKPWKTGTSSRYITNLKQSVLETFNIYDPHRTNLREIKYQHGIYYIIDLHDFHSNYEDIIYCSFETV